MDPLDIQVVSKLTDITVTLKPMSSNANSSHSTPTTPTSINAINPLITAAELPSSNNSSSNNLNNLSKYAQLLLVIEEMSREIRPTYSGSRSSAERLKRGIVHARILVRECLLETERSARN